MVAQQMKVTGVVINEDDGEPVIGASIVVKGTTIGTITDLDGKFELETQKDAKLIISYVGLRTQETTAQQNMRIVLSSDSQAIDESCCRSLWYRKEKFFYRFRIHGGCRFDGQTSIE